jgi:hypothetical protein
MEVFDSITIDCLNGDKYKTGKKTPDGKPDPSVFSTEKNREGIQVGTAIALMERRPQGKARAIDADRAAYNPHADLNFRHWWGKRKRAELEATLETPVSPHALKPALKFGLPFCPIGVRDDYSTWQLLPELLAVSFAGVKTSRDDSLVDMDRAALESRGDWNRGTVTSQLADNFANGLSNFFPLYLKSAVNDAGSSKNAHPDLFASTKPTGPQPNLTDFARKYLAGLKCGPEDLFFHIVAVLHSPLYREENAGALRQDWPRVPLPKDAATLKAGAALGRQLAALLDPETPVPGVTDLKVREDLKGLGELTVSNGKSPNLAIAARWGYSGLAGAVMPGPGKTTSGTRGEGFLDIHLNATTRWKDVPEPVWTYTLGGYQVLKKWLSYRESALLGRPVTSDEAQQFTHHVRRIASILALHEELDRHYGASVF